MSTAGVVLSLSGDRSRARRHGGGDARLASIARASLDAGLETLVVVREEAQLRAMPADAIGIIDGADEPSTCSGVRVALDYCARRGHDAVIVALEGDVVARDERLESRAWQLLSRAHGGFVLLAGEPTRLVRLDVTIWPLVPLDGGLERAWHARLELVSRMTLEEAAAERENASQVSHQDDIARVTELLGRSPEAPFSVVMRDVRGDPLVIANEPFLSDGTPMPTRYWLVGARAREAVGRLEAAGGVREAEQAIAPEEIEEAHRRYAEERDALIPVGWSGPRPSGGVGGTRTGVKCLHADLAWYLVGGRDPVGRWTAMQLSDRLDGCVAAVDCGTNSTRLLVLDPAGRELERVMTITRLGAGVDKSRKLDEAAIERTLATLRDYRDRMDGHGVVAVRAVATSAARDANNAEELFSRAQEVLGVRPELLSGSDEGRLAYAGATASLSASEGPYLVIDVGGGSTELITELDDEPAVASLALGCVRITERFLKSDPPSATELDEAKRHVEDLVGQALSSVPALKAARRLVGVAGTVSCLATLDLGLSHYDASRLHHAVLGRRRVGQLFEELARLDIRARRLRHGMERDRADVIVGGSLVLMTAMDVLGFDELIVSEEDILDALARSLLARP